MDVAVDFFTTTWLCGEQSWCERESEWMNDVTWATDILRLFQVNEMFANDWKGMKGKWKKKKNDKSNFEKALRVGKVLFSFSFSFRFVLPRVEFFSPFSVFLSHWLMVWGRENIYTQHGNREWYSRNSNIKLWEK